MDPFFGECTLKRAKFEEQSEALFGEFAQEIEEEIQLTYGHAQMQKKEEPELK